MCTTLCHDILAVHGHVGSVRTQSRVVHGLGGLRHRPHRPIVTVSMYDRDFRRMHVLVFASLQACKPAIVFLHTAMIGH